MKYKELYGLSDSPAICALENKKTKRVLLFASSNPLLYLSKLISSLITKRHTNQDLIRDRKRLKLTVLETGTDDKWSLNYWYNEYSRNGYTFYSSKKPLQLIVHLRIDYRYGAMVELRNKGGKAIVVGVFKTLDDAIYWTDMYYPNLDYVNPIFAVNEETRNYYLTQSRN